MLPGWRLKKNLIITINHGDGTLGRLNRDPEPFNKLISILDRADRTLQDIQVSVGTAAKLVNDKELYLRMNRMVEDVAALVKDFKEQPRKHIKFSVF